MKGSMKKINLAGYVPVIKYCLVLLCLISINTATYAQPLSNTGKEFWVGYGHHQFMEPGHDNSQVMTLYLSTTDKAARVTVTIDSSGDGTSFLPVYSRTYNIPPNTVISTETATPASWTGPSFPWRSSPPNDQMPSAGDYDARLYTLPPAFDPTSTGGEGIFRKKGIHIVSDVPIVAYEHAYGSASSGATMLMPVNTWGYTYTCINSRQQYNFDCFSWIYVVAQHDSTLIEITPSVKSRLGKTPGVPFRVVLNKGWIYQLIGATSGSSGLELTGTTVKSIGNSDGNCFPIAVFCGSSRTSNPASCGGGGGDNDNQQMFPQQAWGKRYLTSPLAGANGPSAFMTNPYKIVIKDPTTVVKRNGTVLTPVSTAGGQIYYYFESNTPDYIEADKPIMLAQFMGGGSGCLNGNIGDPEMIYVSPIEQGISRVAFYRNTRENITLNGLTMVVPTKALSSIRIDGGLLGTQSYTVVHPRNPDYTIVQKEWTAQQKQCIVTCDSAFTAVTYGLGSVESYGYNAGTMINNLALLSSIHNAADTSELTNAYTCRNTPFELSMQVGAYKPTKVVWRLSQLSNLSPNADITDYNPKPTDSVFKFGVWYYNYKLPGTYTFADSGTFYIPITMTSPSIDNCKNTDDFSLTVVVKQDPKAFFTITHSGCIKDTVAFTSPAGTGNGYDIKTWKWKFPDGSTDTARSPKKLFTTTGTQNVLLSVITAEGCVRDTTEPVMIYAPPVASITANPTTGCLGDSLYFTGAATFGGTGKIQSWYWNFGNGKDSTALTQAPMGVLYSAGTYNVKLVAKVSAACMSDTFSQPVKMYAKPNLSFVYPAGCLPVTGVVQFNNTSTTPDGQTISTFAWDFGDAANSSPTNPNTSTQENPAHTYSKYGTYNIKFTATTANGCSRDTTVAAVFNLKPTLTYSAIPDVCENAPAFPVSGASVTNGVTGKGYYKGLGTDSAGNFKPSTAGAGKHTIWYVFTSTAGCSDSVSQTFTLYPKPASSFAISNSNICVDSTVTITDASTIASGNMATWNWDLGNGTKITNATNTALKQAYNTAKSFDVKLYVVSDKNCISDTVTHTVTARPLPQADFVLPQVICMPAGKAQFNNASNISDGTALTYQWNFGDASATAPDNNPVHIYNAFGPYNVKLTVTSVYGCRVDTVKSLNNFYDKPVASFTVQPDTLCQGNVNTFTNTSSAPNSTVKYYNWNFGDRNISSDKNPIKTYSKPGNYTVSLSVTNAVGCMSDTFYKPIIVYLQPVITAGPSFVVPQGTTVVFSPTANDSSVLKFLWTPSADFADATLLRPSLVAMKDATYVLTATGPGKCTAVDSLTVKVLKPVKIPNAFSPNGDGINDKWHIPNLQDYPGSVVDVYDRGGQRVYHSDGYSVEWDGTKNGKPLPIGTYYYIINLRNGYAPLTGYIAIIK
ncbi:PKD domain-containing protein [Chitinophagaceae bacterium LWZ2-11]